MRGLHPVFVDELTDEPALGAWLHAAGLTLAEAAAIQPGYRYQVATRRRRRALSR